jgi:2-polyprenyl-3-methyl-5-hydroxy-6-metoxy-1,4-benzoquinol methylase
MNLAEHYKSLLLKYGDSPEASQWSSIDTQEKRFEILTQIGNLDNKSILDFGCGTGHLVTYLENRGLKFTYTGVDIVDDLLEVAKQKHPQHNFSNFDEICNQNFDYVLISGVFNNRIEDNLSSYQKIVKECFSLAKEGLAFNMLSHYVDFYNPDLFYEKPETLFEFLKKEVSPYITIRNDYQVKNGVIPFEFTVYIYKK